MADNITPRFEENGAEKAEEKRYLHAETTDGVRFHYEVQNLSNRDLINIVANLARSIRKDAEEVFGKAKTSEAKAANKILSDAYIRFTADLFHKAVDRGFGLDAGQTDDAGNEPDAPAEASEEAEHE